MRSIKRLELPLLLLAALGCGQAIGRIPTLSSVELDLSKKQAIEREGNIESLLSGFDGAQEWLQWSILYDQTLIALLSGNRDGFSDGLRKLESREKPPDLGSSWKLAELYSVAVEVHVESIDARRYADAVELAKEAARKLPGLVDVPPKPFDDKLLANLHFHTGNLTALRSLYRDRRAQAHGAEQQLALGYIALLLARIDQTEASAKRAVHDLTGLADESAGHFDQIEGLASLYLSEAYSMLAAQQGAGDRSLEYVARAKEFAARARRSLDVLDFPVFWGLALKATADALALEAERLPADAERQRKELELQRDRAYNLSLMYR